jgi:hypothetical protein
MNGEKTPAPRGRLQLAPKYNVYWFSELNARLDTEIYKDAKFIGGCYTSTLFSFQQTIF